MFRGGGQTWHVSLFAEIPDGSRRSFEGLVLATCMDCTGAFGSLLMTVLLVLQGVLYQSLW